MGLAIQHLVQAAVAADAILQRHLQALFGKVLPDSCDAERRGQGTNEHEETDFPDSHGNGTASILLLITLAYSANNIPVRISRILPCPPAGGCPCKKTENTDTYRRLLSKYLN
jgi:hypothetical protein